MRIMEDKVDRKPKGFGYVEFASPEGLRAALAKSESSFMGRNVKISVADPRMYLLRFVSRRTLTPPSTRPT